MSKSNVNYITSTFMTIVVKYADPIDCSDCHLAWLIRDNRNLLPAVYLGQCSNGTTFEDLDPIGYNECPILSTDTTPLPY